MKIILEILTSFNKGSISKSMNSLQNSLDLLTMFRIADALEAYTKEEEEKLHVTLLLFTKKGEKIAEWTSL
jgi:hypothetical protein